MSNNEETSSNQNQFNLNDGLTLVQRVSLDYYKLLKINSILNHHDHNDGLDHLIK